jgi:hypothetical protein
VAVVLLVQPVAATGRVVNLRVDHLLAFEESGRLAEI